MVISRTRSLIISKKFRTVVLYQEQVLIFWVQQLWILRAAMIAARGLFMFLITTQDGSFQICHRWFQANEMTIENMTIVSVVSAFGILTIIIWRAS
jgi:hypothetical protein